jgi:hypothetical protein
MLHEKNPFEGFLKSIAAKYLLENEIIDFETANAYCEELKDEYEKSSGKQEEKDEEREGGDK